ncbi:hypothetical protein BDW75DRAFT_235477 [Aspergillus navahoensis]
MNSFKQWAPPPKKPILPKKTRHHHLPARPPAEVCMLVSADTQLYTPSMRPDSESKTFPEKLDRGASPRDSVPHNQAPAPDPISRCDLQDNAGTSTELPAFRGDYAEDGLSSRSILSSDDSLEESFRPRDAHEDVPIDPLILSSDGSWRDINLQSSVPQDSSLVNLETTCPTDSASYPDRAHGNHLVNGGSKSSKQKAHQSEGQARKRYQVHSAVPSREGSFTTLQSHFVSLPLNNQLQFLSWLYKGALTHCTSDSSLLTACEDGEARITSRWSPQLEIKESPGVWKGVQGSSRKGRSRGAIQVFWYTTLSKKRAA